MYEIIGNIKHGNKNDNGFKRLAPGDIVEDDFFTDSEKKKLTSSSTPYIKKVVVEKNKKPSAIETIKVKPLVDLSTITVAKSKELLNDVKELSNLERYLDQERSRGEFERRSLTRFIEGLIHELTGYTYTNK